jgi:hypothetical protein
MTRTGALIRLHQVIDLYAEISPPECGVTVQFPGDFNARLRQLDRCWACNGSV